MFAKVDLDRLTCEEAEIEQPDEEPRSDSALSEAAEQELLELSGVVGVGQGAGDEIVVFVRDTQTATHLPRSIEGRPIRPKVSGEVRAL